MAFVRCGIGTDAFVKAMCWTLSQAGGAASHGLVSRKRAGLLLGRLIFYNPQLCDLFAADGWVGWGWGWGEEVMHRNDIYEE